MQDYKDRLCHEAEMETDLSGGAKGLQHYEQASLIAELLNEIAHAKSAAN